MQSQPRRRGLPRSPPLLCARAKDRLAQNPAATANGRSWPRWDRQGYVRSGIGLPLDTTLPAFALSHARTSPAAACVAVLRWWPRPQALARLGRYMATFIAAISHSAMGLSAISLYERLLRHPLLSIAAWRTVQLLCGQFPQWGSIVHVTVQLRARPNTSRRTARRCTNVSYQGALRHWERNLHKNRDLGSGHFCPLLARVTIWEEHR